MSSNQTAAKGACPVCGRHMLEELSRIEHADRSTTVYWRCAGCSHIQVKDAPAGRTTQRDSDAKPV